MLNFFNFKNNKPVNKKHFKVCYPIASKSIAYPNIILDVNFKKQFKFINKIYENLYIKNKKFLTKDIIKYLKKNEQNLFKNN